MNLTRVFSLVSVISKSFSQILVRVLITNRKKIDPSDTFESKNRSSDFVIH